MITLQCRLGFQNEQDRKAVLELMRRFSSAMRFAYQRLLEGEDRKDLKILYKSLQSGKSEPATQHHVNLWKEQVRGSTQVGQKSWRVLSVALAFSCLEGFRDFSPLKRVILLGDWVGVAIRLVPTPGVGTMVLPNTACWGWECLKRRNINTPAQTVQTDLYSFV
jgi:predicted transposase